MKIDSQASNSTKIAIAVLAVIIIAGIVVCTMSKLQSEGSYPPGVKVPSPHQIGQYQAAHPLPGPGVPSLARRLGQ